MTIRCPHCGTTNRTGSNYCNNCGANLRPDEATSVQPPAEEASREADTERVDADLTLNQPWLRPEEEQAEEQAPDADQTTSPGAKRLIANIQGLLEPVRVFSETTDETVLPLATQPAAPVELSAEQLRRMRSLMVEEPLLLEPPAPAVMQRLPALRMPWLFVLFGLAVGVPLLLLVRSPAGEAQVWPGVTAAYEAVLELPTDATVLLLWAYDPATAGELDLVALPLVVHLVERQVRPVVVSLLPNGPATARRLFARATAATTGAATALAGEAFVSAGFLPGGVVALPLLGQDLATGLNAQSGVVAPAVVAAAEQPPALAIIVAAQAEEVQQWLEQAQPLDNLPAVAFTSAGADPMLRPYLDSGQLRGLVSGFDGAQAYQELLERPLSEDERVRSQQQLVLQNWGQIALLLVIVLGNLAAIFGNK